MRNTMILMILIAVGFSTPALADGRRGEGRESGHRVEREYRDHARHDRGDQYKRFQKRMKHLRKELRQERKQNRRLERREAKRMERRAYRRDQRREYRRHWHRPAPVVVAPRREYRPLLFPRIVVRIPLNW